MKILKSLFIAAVAVAGISLAGCNGKTDSKAEDKDKTEKADDKVTDAPAVAAIIDFNATWCGPCKQFAPIFEAAAEKYGDKVEFRSVDVDENPELAQKYGVQSIPMVVFVDKDGNVVDQFTGFMEAPEFEEIIANYVK